MDFFRGLATMQKGFKKIMNYINYVKENSINKLYLFYRMSLKNKIINIIQTNVQ